jgi:hypothetical protein
VQRAARYPQAKPLYKHGNCPYNHGNPPGVFVIIYRVSVFVYEQNGKKSMDN